MCDVCDVCVCMYVFVSVSEESGDHGRASLTLWVHAEADGLLGGHREASLLLKLGQRVQGSLLVCQRQKPG